MSDAPGPTSGLTLGPLHVPTPVVLAPMAGITNAAYRRLCAEQGAGLYVCEMITSRGLVEGDKHTLDMLVFDEAETTRLVQLYGSDPEMLGRAVHMVCDEGLVDHVDKHPDRLSGGQQQRVALVRALCTRPDLLLLDEITAALDPELVGEVLTIVRDLAERGTTMILATHEMSFAREVATSVCFLSEGRILEQGPPAEIFSQPREERTRQFLRRVPPPSG